MRGFFYLKSAERKFKVCFCGSAFLGFLGLLEMVVKVEMKGFTEGESFTASETLVVVVLVDKVIDLVRFFDHAGLKKYFHIISPVIDQGNESG